MSETSTELWGTYTPQSERVTQTNNAATTISRKSNDELDKNSFLLLLITQMQYQDPLNPVEDKEFIAQMAQFSALEQMQNLNATMTNSQTFSLVGKYVSGQIYNDQTGEYTDVAGRVDSVIIKNKKPFLVVGKQELLAEEVTDVFEDEYQLSIAQAQASNAFASQNINLIGKFIQAITYDSKGEATGFVEGKVEYVKLVDGTPVLVVGSKEVYPSELVTVSDKMMLVGKTIKVLGKNDENEEIYTDATVQGVVIADKQAHLSLSNGSTIEIEKIDVVTEALKCVDNEVTTSSGKVKISGVTIKDKVPHLITEDGDAIAFSSVIR